MQTTKNKQHQKRHSVIPKETQCGTLPGDADEDFPGEASQPWLSTSTW